MNRETQVLTISNDRIIPVDGQATVRDLIGGYPQARQVFEKHGIDYCCGGGRRLADAVAEGGLELVAVVAALEEAVRTAPKQDDATAKDWYAARLDELIGHIVDVHHGYMKQVLPRLGQLIRRVQNAHGVHHGPMLCEVGNLFEAIDDELTSHLAKEEEILFPYIVALEAHVRDGAAKPFFGCGSVRNPIWQMEHEHESAGQALAKLREVTGNFTLPPDACPTFAALYEELQQMEKDLHEHIHLENNILFPRAIEMESSVGHCSGCHA